MTSYKEWLNMSDEEKYALKVEELYDELESAENEIANLHMKLEIAMTALNWIADKKTDSSGAHSMRSAQSAKEALSKIGELDGKK